MGKRTVLLLFLCLLPADIYGDCLGTRQSNFPTLPRSYQTVIEINMDNQDYSILEREYRDGDGNRTMISQLLGKKSRVILDENNKQALHINESQSTCTVTSLSAISSDDYPFGWSNKVNGQHLYSTKKIFDMVKGKAVMAKKLENIRGINVQHWCTPLTIKDREVEVHMYFTAPKWKTAGGFPQKPVRFVLSENSTEPNAFNHNYEYYTFYSKIRDNPMSVFEPPTGVICKGRKATKKIPKLPTYFSYRQEVSYDEYVKISDVWYDGKNRLLRIDYRPEGMGNEVSATLSEVHDYNTGVRYVKNLYLGNCSASTITNSSFGTEQNATSWKKDKSYEVMLKNPLQYFYLDSNYVYVGKKMARQILCDVFSSTRKSFMMPDGKHHPVVMEFYFASDDYTILPDKANNITVQVPVMLLVSSVDDLSLRINIVDFNEQQHDFSVFDVSSCYSSAVKMHITILMDGQYVESTKEEIIGEGQIMIADLMKISRNRVQNVETSHDAASIALYASILDRSPPSAQFSRVSTKKQTVRGDKTFKGVKTMADCADKCVQSTDFVCNSFDICGSDCILSKTHIATGVSSGGTATCNHYSRTVDGPKIKEISLKSAWYNLRSGIAQGLFLLDIPNDFGDSTYKAIFARLDTGVISPLIDIPKLRDNLSYMEEIVSPSSKDIQPVSVYYDEPKNLTRYDTFGSQKCTFCHGAVENILDFQVGVKYLIDKTSGQCQAEQFDSVSFTIDKEDPSHKKLMKMKDVLDLFYIDETYSFVGQNDARGIMTDIFEAWRTDFSGDNDALFRYHFLSENWNSISASIPLKLEIVADLDEYNAVYNIFEFIEKPVPMSKFDVTECYRESGNIIDFQIKFGGVYKLQPENFIRSVIKLIKDYTHISGIRIQEPEISFDDESTYFQASLLEAPPTTAMFHRIDNMITTLKPGKILTNIDSAIACADQCVKSTTLNCNAFQYCEISKRCELHTKHFGDSHQKGSQTCSFYTRTEDAPLDMISAKQVMTDLINLARKGIFKIDFTVGKSAYHFTAKSVLTNIDRDNSRNIASVQNMKSYKKSFGSSYLKQYGSIFMKVSIDDCALKCTQSQTLNCEAFSYCYLQGQCVLSENHPTNDTIETSSWCDIYERDYLNLFEELPGKTFVMQGETEIADVTDPDTCARHCFNEGVENCQSFEYCKDMNSCSFSKKHTMDVPQTDLIGSFKCSVYSLTFLKDFRKASTKIEHLVDNVLIRNVSVKQCARICLKDQGLNCASFDYCPSDRICRITGFDEFRKTQVSGPVQLNCSHYIRIDSKVSPPTFYQKETKGNKGTAAGLGIGMFILGAVLGILVIFFVHKKGTFSTDDHMKVNFLKLEDQ